jgi:Na+/glutamate symporter
MSDWAHKLLSGIGNAAAVAVVTIAYEYRDNWKIALACTCGGIVLSTLGFAVAKPYGAKKDNGGGQ